MPQSLAAMRRGELAVIDHDRSVHEHQVEALRVLMWLREGRFILDAGRIEQHEIGRHAFADQAPIAEAEGAGGKGSHPSDGVFEIEDTAIANVFAEQDRKSV